MMNKMSIAMLAVNIITPLVAAVFVFLRFKARKIRSGHQIDDWATVVALVFCIGLGINTTIGVAYGVIGKAKSELSLGQIEMLLKIIYADSFIYFTSIAIIKVAVLLFYKRIFSSPRFTLVINTLMGVTIAWWIASMLCLLFSFSPISAHWNAKVVDIKKNINFQVFLLTHAALDLFLDIVTLCLPIRNISQLTMSVVRRAGVIGIFWLGSFCCIAEAVRISYFYKFLYQSTAAHADAFGPVVANALIWSRIEPCCSVIAACLPTLGTLVRDGRGPESLIASIRNIFSLRSFSSNSFNSKKNRQSSQDTSSSKASRVSKFWGDKEPMNLEVDLSRRGEIFATEIV